MKPYARENPVEWLPYAWQREMYQNTTGPYGSPDPVECWLLHGIAHKCSGNVLELGSWRGRSACFIGHALTQHRHLYCVDHFKGDSTGGKDPSKEAMEQVIARYGLEQTVIIVEADMLTLDFSQFEDVGMVFYDSDHSTEPTVQVLTKLAKHINSDALIAIHDADFPTTQSAIAQLGNLYEVREYYPVWHGFSVLALK